MAYTYDDFVAAANNAGLLNMFSETDLNTAKSNPEYGLSMLKLQQDIGSATTAEQKLLAEEAANQLRKSYGTLTTPTTGSSFSYEGQDAYDQLLNDITNYKSFEYDPETDPRMAAYRKTYLREAERARADTLAKTSAATGGVPSSYAVGAAEQAGNYYTGQLNDVIPELFNDAYSQYMNDFTMKNNALGAMETDRQFDYTAWLGGLEEKQQQWNNAMAMYQLFGYEAPEEYLNILGIQKPEPVVYSGGEEQKSTYRKPAVDTGEDTGDAEWASGIDETRNQSGLKGSSWDYTYHNLKQLVNSGNTATAEKYMTQVAGQMNEKQFNQAASLFKKK